MIGPLSSSKVPEASDAREWNVPPPLLLLLLLLLLLSVCCCIWRGRICDHVWREDIVERYAAVVSFSPCLLLV
jgi:hypothetical protein